MQGKLQTIPSNKINIAKWNACIHQNNAPIYASFEYINTMAINWTSLVLNDYEGVFPICYKKKMGITYCYTPPFIQKLGWIGKQIDWNILQQKIFKIVSYGDIMLNELNPKLQTGIATKNNFVIDLNQSYESIFNNYKTDLKQNLKKAAKANFVYNQSNNADKTIDLYQNFYANRMQKMSSQDFNNFKKVCHFFQADGNCIIRQVLNTKNELMAVALLLKHNNRIYNLANSTTALGRKSEANHFLLDRIVNEFANQNIIFDFEGSDLPGVKAFYEKFGAVNQPYFHWHFNHLPWWIKWAKKKFYY